MIAASLGSKRKVLVVEDDDDVRAFLQIILKRQGYEVACAGSGTSAFAAMSESTPELILLDMAMPEMDGLTFLRCRTQFTDFRDIPVICVSAYDRSSDIRAAEQLGANGYVTKPFDAGKLLASVARLMPKTQLYKSAESKTNSNPSRPLPGRKTAQ